MPRVSRRLRLARRAWNLWMRSVYGTLGRVEVIGLDNVPRAGPALLVSNHLSNLDPTLLGGVISRHVYFMAKAEILDFPILGWGPRLYGAFPVHRGEADRQAVRTALTLLGDGNIVALFPEGHRSHDTCLQVANPGTALIALKSKAPILPVAITGTDRVMGRIWRRPRIQVVLGHPFNLGNEFSSTGREGILSATSFIMGRVAALLPAERRGPYAFELRSKEDLE